MQSCRRWIGREYFTVRTRSRRTLGLQGGRHMMRLVGVRLSLRHGQRVVLHARGASRSTHQRRRGRGNAHAQTAEHQSLLQELGRRCDRLLRLGLLALHLLVLDRVEVDLAHAIHHVLVLERHKAEAAVTPRLLVHQHHSLLHLAELAKVRLHLVRGRLLAHAAHKNLLRLVRRLGPVLGRRVLWVDLLAVQRVNRHLEHLLHAAGVRERDEAETATPLEWAGVGLIDYLFIKVRKFYGHQGKSCD